MNEEGEQVTTDIERAEVLSNFFASIFTDTQVFPSLSFP